MLRRGRAASNGNHDGDQLLVVTFALTVFVGAALLFVVQPMFARMVLPLLGGSPSVWNTSLVFYQGVLLAGYGYAHLARRFTTRRLAGLHVLLLLLPLWVLPIGMPAGWIPPAAASPVSWLLALLLVSVGPPFFAVSTTSPLLQHWFAKIGRGAGDDPYFLYAASNAGSLAALVAYPVIVEPHLPLREQSRLWAAGYGLLVVLTAACALFLWRSNGDAGAGRRTKVELPAVHRFSSPGSGRRLRWVLLSFVPSGLLVGVTAYLTTDLAAIPLLWIVPLALYLLTFILAFAPRARRAGEAATRLLPVLVVALAIVLAMRLDEPIELLMPLHLATFFAVALVCHSRLAQERPPTEDLTAFYWWLSIGGVLGGAFAALAAPLLFPTVVEYPLLLMLGGLLGLGPRPALTADEGSFALRRPRWHNALALDLALPVALGALMVGLIARAQSGALGVGALGQALVFGPPALICLSFRRRPLRFALGTGALLLVGGVMYGDPGNVLHAERSFFGIHRVKRVVVDEHDKPGALAEYHVLVHGTTVHGIQSFDPARRREPLAYYHPTGPVGQLFAALNGLASTGTAVSDEVARPPQSAAVIGLGAGSLACYGAPGQRWTFYEIDPAVERIARDTRYFTFLDDCPPEIEVVLGDARLTLAEAPDGEYRVLVLDAYSSDAIPLHLLTREALRLYVQKLAAGGVLAFHISNRHLDLEPVLANLAHDAGLVALIREDTLLQPGEVSLGKIRSRWVAIARRRADLGALTDDARWRPAREDPRVRLWTDGYAGIVSVLRRR